MSRTRNIWMTIAIALIVVGMGLVTVGRADALVTQEQYDHVKIGMSRAHVENVVFEGDHGVRTAMWAGPHRRHLEKTYDSVDGKLIVIRYSGKLTRHPLKGPYHVDVISQKESE